jgi:hypothetical protein
VAFGLNQQVTQDPQSFLNAHAMSTVLMSAVQHAPPAGVSTRYDILRSEDSTNPGVALYHAPPAAPSTFSARAKPRNARRTCAACGVRRAVHPGLTTAAPATGVRAMPITAGDLQAGDILFKHASRGLVSQRIAAGQKSHYDATIRHTGPSPVGARAATDITHVALAARCNDVMEFDEGGSSTFQILFRSGHGFVRGNMTLPSRLHHQYEVFRCLNAGLAASAVDKAELIWDLTHQGGAVASYGVTKMLKTAIGHQHGPSASSVEYFEAALDRWLQSASGGGIFHRTTNIQFFCSEFVSFCYLWAAAETKLGHLFGADYLIGTNRVKIAPVELYTRLDTVGRGTFQFRGTLYT